MHPLAGLSALSTLRLAHNQLPARALQPLATALGGLALRRLELYANPIARDPAFPDALLRVQVCVGMHVHVHVRPSPRRDCRPRLPSLTPSHALPRLLTPAHAFARLRSPPSRSSIT